MITSYLTGEIMRQRSAEAIERGERSRLAAVAKKAARDRRRAARTARAEARRPAPEKTPSGNAEPGAAMSC